MWYRSGLVSVTNGSTTVTGSGTDWIAGVGVGEAFNGPDGRVYEIASIVSATQLTLGSAYLGSSASAQQYQIIPSQSYIRDLAAQAAQLVSDYASVASNAGSGKFSDGTASAPGIRFTSDENVGIRRAGEDDMRLVASGVDQAQVSSLGFSVQDGKLRITGSSDATKVASFEVDGFTTGTTRTFTLPNVNTTVAGTHNKISDFAAVTSAELATKVTGSTGTGALVFGTAATLTNPIITGGTVDTGALRENGVGVLLASDVSLTAAPDKIPKSGADGRLDQSWYAQLAESPIRLNPSRVTANFTVPSGYNAASVGPIAIAEGVTVTIQDRATWSVH